MILVLKHNFQKVLNRVMSELQHILLMHLVLKYFESTVHIKCPFLAIAKTYVLLIDVSLGDTRKVYIIDYDSAKKLAILHVEPNYAWRYCKTECHIARIFKFPSRIPFKS